MIQNITRGSSARGVLEYVHTKEGAERVAGNLAGRTPLAMEREWDVYREMNGRVEQDVWHSSLSLPEGEQLDEYEWAEVATKYTEAMGFGDSAWVAYRHQDTEHDHIHIVANRVDFEGRAVDVWKDYTRGEKQCRRFEREYDLREVAPSREADKAAPTRAEAEIYKRTGDVPVKMDLQAKVDAASRRVDEMGAYVDELESEGVAMELRRREDGTPYGVTYVREADGEKMKGSDLGRAFGWGGLQKKAGIDHEYERDDEKLRQSEARARAAGADGGRGDRGPEEAGKPDEPLARGGTRRSPGASRGDTKQERRRVIERRGGDGPSTGEGRQKEAQEDRPAAGRDRPASRADAAGDSPDRRAGRQPRGDSRGDGAGAGRSEDRRGDSQRRDLQRDPSARSKGRRHRRIDRVGDDGSDRHSRDVVSEQSGADGRDAGPGRANGDEYRERDTRSLDEMDGRAAPEVEGSDRPELANRVDLSPEMRRELWHVRQIEEREEMEHQTSGALRGKVADLEEFEDGTTSVVVADEERGRFAIVDVPGEKVDDLFPGDAAEVPRGRSTVRKRDRDRGIER